MATESSSKEGNPAPQPHVPIFREIPINKPTPFTGNRTRVRGFLQQCHGYLHLNKPIFTTDEAKIAFILSFLTDGEALKWRETYLSGLMTDDGEFTYPTFKAFITLFSAYFRPINEAQTANNQLATLRQGKRTVEEYVAEFRLLITQAGMTSNTSSDHTHLINYFRRGLNPAIAKKIALADTVPATIDGWADRAIQYDTNYRLTMAMFGNGNNERSYGGYGSGRGNINTNRDPNAMDVDAMTTEKRTMLMKQGLCFKCEGKGHLARDCKGKKKETTPPKRTVKDIHALLTALSAEEAKELLALQNKEAEEKKEDF